MIRRMAAWIARNHWRFSPMNFYEKLEGRRFDSRHGVDTQNDVNLSDLHIDSPSKLRGHRYHATPPLSFRRVLKKLRVNFAD